MITSLDLSKAQVIQETLAALDYLGNELVIPPMYSCLQMGGFCFSNILAYYANHQLEPPKELEEFMKFLPKLQENLNGVIELQYLTLNTQGTA